MKAAVHLVVEFVNTALFLLSATVYGPSAVLATSLVSWWFVSDYYFARWSWWTWWMDRFAFMASTLVVLLAFAAGTRWRLHRIARGLAPQYEDYRGSPASAELPLRAWYEHLGSIATFRHGLWARYWTWRQSRLAGLSDSGAFVDAGSLATLWWPRWAGIGAWSIAALFPVLWIVLLLTPLHTNAMEHVAAWASIKDPEISAVRCTGRVGNPGDAVDEPLQRESRGFYRNGVCLYVAVGAFQTTASDFPRVYRHVVVQCLNRCTVAAGPGAKPVYQLSVACVGGKASFEWTHPEPDPRSGLGMAVMVARQDNAPLASVLIEP